MLENPLTFEKKYYIILRKVGKANLRSERRSKYGKRAYTRF
jgi:hypothetical protein